MAVFEAVLVLRDDEVPLTSWLEVFARPLSLAGTAGTLLCALGCELVAGPPVLSVGWASGVSADTGAGGGPAGVALGDGAG